MLGDSALVSVIIPSYNYAEYLRAALDSVFAQEVGDMEVILVDDGSTDDTRLLADSYGCKIRYLYQENSGLAAARNRGIMSSSGRFVQFLDADDLLGPGTIVSQLKYLERNLDIHVVVCENRLFGETTADGHPKLCGSRELFQQNLDVHLCYFNIAPPHAFLWRREAIVETGWFDPYLTACEDYDFWIRAAVRGFAPHYNPSGVVYYRRHADSMSANAVNQHFHDGLLHKRVSSILDEFAEFPKGKRLEGLLAFSAGAILTASRLLDDRLGGTQELMQLAVKHTEEAKRLVRGEKSGWNLLTKLLYFRINHFLACRRFAESTEAKAIHENLRQILGSLDAPISKIGLLADGLKSRVAGTPRSLLERKELGSLVWHCMKKQLFRSLFPDGTR